MGGNRLAFNLRLDRAGRRGAARVAWLGLRGGRLQTNQLQTAATRLTWRIRWIAVRALAAAIAGVVVLGIGGRLVMLASRLLHPEAVGRITENGNRIGEFTTEGTIGLVLFGGLLGGLVAGVIWVLVREWVPRSASVVGLGAVMVGGFSLVEADNRDFVILGDPRPDLVLLLGLIFLFGVTVVGLDSWLERRLPQATSASSIVVYSLLVAFGFPFLGPVFGNFFSRDFCFCTNPPIWTGVFLVAATVITVLWWIFHLRGAESPPRTLKNLGLAALALMVIAGAAHLTGEVLHIL